MGEAVEEDKQEDEEAPEGIDSELQEPEDAAEHPVKEEEFEAHMPVEPRANDWDDTAPPPPPPAKRLRTAGPSGALEARPPKALPPAAPPSAAARRPLVADAPLTPGCGPQGVELCDEHPDWAARCTIDAAKPGQPQRLTINMAEVEFGDTEIAEWCDWMDRRLAVERSGSAGGVRFKAATVDFSENRLGVAGIKALCLLLEKRGVRADVLRLTGNLIGNEGVRCISKYLTSSSQALATELHLSRNRFSVEGVKWLLGSLTMHPAYPIWNGETQRYCPMWLRMESAKLKGAAGYGALAAACTSLCCTVCLGERMGDSKCGPRQCVNTGCCDEIKHNCVAHLCHLEAPPDAAPLVPAAHARPFFAAPGKGAPRAPPSGCEEPLRDEPRVIYEDDDLAVILKPAGWSCQPNPKGINPAWSKLKPLARRQHVGQLMAQHNPPPLQAYLLLHFGADPTCEASRDQQIDRGIAHRLDIDTSGPLLVGKTMQGFEHAKKQIALGVLKDYVALVHGSFSLDRGECRAPIDASPFAETKRVRIDSQQGAAACTVWEALAEYESQDGQDTYTLVNCRMITLRTHQIRVHMQHLGHPLVGDKLYGSGDVPEFCPRMFVHKARIGFMNLQGQACFESASLQTVPDLWQSLGRLRKVGGMAMQGCGAPGL